MRIARTFFTCLIIGLLIAAPAAGAPQRPDQQSCSWCLKIEKQIQLLQKQLDALYALLHYYISHKETLPASSAPKIADQATSSVQYPVPSGASSQSSIISPPTTIFVHPTPATQTYKSPLPTSTMSYGKGYRSVAYFVNWGIYGRKYFPQTIPADKLTHVLYSFGDNRPDGEVILTDQWSDIQIHYDGDSWNDQGNNLYGNLKQLNLLKKKNRNMKVLLSIGGWTYAHEQKHFDAPAATPEGRKRFADSCVQLIKDLGFDGIDIDWEYPQNPEQGQQLLLLLQAIRVAMDAYANQIATGSEKPHFVLSIAAPAGESNYKNMPLGALAQVLDFINLMAYDFSGSWESHASHQANLFRSNSCPSCTPFNIDSVVDVYIAQGVPSDKIVLGMPLYGRAFTNTSGIGQPFQGVGEGSWEQGVWDYKALPRPGAQEHVDEEAGASYSYDPNSKTLVTYDTLPMAQRKVQYIKQHKLGGAMWWELSGDRQDNGSIVSNVVRELGGSNGANLEQQPNWLTYKESQYDNLKNGFPNN